MDALRTFVIALGSKLTERRIRVHALILAIGLWSLYAVDLSTPGLRDRAGQIKGADFAHFFVLGTLANRGEGSLLYDIPQQSALLAQLVPDSAGLVYMPLYGPQVSLLYAPLAKLSYVPALIAWSILTTVLYGVSCFLIWRACPRLRSSPLTTVIAALGYPAFFAVIAWGQSSAPALLAFVLAFLAVRAQHRFASGLALGLLAFKPSLAIAAAVVFVFSAEWTLVAGALLSAAAQVAIAWQHYGTAVMKQYVSVMWRTPRQFALVEPRIYLVHSLRAFWTMIVPNAGIAWALYFLSAAAVLLLAIAVWRSPASLALKYSAVLVATALVSPHLNVYDLLILAPVFLLIADWIRAEARTDERWLTAGLLYLSYALPLLGPLARWTHLQLSVLAMAGLLGWIWKKATGKDVLPLTARQSVLQ